MVELGKKNIKNIENHLIEKLDSTFGKICVNERNDDGKLAQRGGACIKLLKGDVISVYVFYKLDIIFV